jgi:hypothetical protein
MTIYDAIEILNGAPDAATQYLMRTTGDELRAQFLPIVRDTLDQTSATRYYSDIVQQYNSLPLVSDVNPDLDQYATDKAVAGLFVLIAEEEANIRANPAARTTRSRALPVCCSACSAVWISARSAIASLRRLDCRGR